MKRKLNEVDLKKIIKGSERLNIIIKNLKQTIDKDGYPLYFFVYSTTAKQYTYCVWLS